MRKEQIVKGTVSTESGFYVGDVCYVLGDAVYDNMWGRLYNYEDGVHYIEGRDASFAVGPTRHGDGEYIDNEYRVYGVDAGVIGLVPFELIDKAEGKEFGYIWEGSGAADFSAVNGVFDITMPDGKKIHIDTDLGGNDEEYFEPEDDDEDEDVETESDEDEESEEEEQ